jgi:hypothetical protein
MNSYGGVGVEVHVFLTKAIVESEWLASHRGHLTYGKVPGTHWIGGWVDFKVGLDAEGKR